MFDKAQSDIRHTVNLVMAMPLALANSVLQNVSRLLAYNVVLYSPRMALMFSKHVEQSPPTHGPK